VVFAPQEPAKGTRRAAQTSDEWLRDNPARTTKQSYEEVLREARAKFFKADPGGPVAAATSTAQTSKRVGDAPQRGREMLPEWTPSQKADVALRMFRGTKRVARIPLCAETAEKYRELMFLVARDELNKFLARHPDPNKNPRSPEWQIQTLMYRSGVVARSPDADSRTLSPQPEWVDFGSVRTALDSVQGQVYGDGKPCIRYTGERVTPLVAEARKGDPLAWEAACRLAARMIEQGDPLPPNLAGFAVDVLLGKTTKPKRQGRSRSAHVVRDAAIRNAARVLESQHNFGPRTRNKASDPYSICDAIAEALDIKYEAVVKVVSRRK